MLHILEKAIAELRLTDLRIAVAVSGGVDSVSLLHGLGQSAKGCGLILSVAHVNHQLRGEESEAEEEFVRELSKELGLDFAVRRVDPKTWQAARSGRERPTLQEAARTLRYRALREIAVELGAQRVATAHHLNDQVETVLLRLLRGTGPDGLGGIPEVGHDGLIVRPLLLVSREQICAYASKWGLQWREDSSNASDRYRRNTLRSNWIPKLEEAFNPRLLNAVAQLAEAQRRDSEWIESLVDAEAETRFKVCTEGLSMVRQGWQEVPDALARRLARRALCELGQGREATRTHLERIVNFWRHGQTRSYIELPGHLVLRCERDRFCLGLSGAAAGGVVS